ncbi:MAG: hypothetical protein ACK5HR_05250 [Mycoplasmatales bacterium]
MEKIKGSPLKGEYKKIRKSLLKERLINGNTIKKQISKMDYIDYKNLMRFKGNLGLFLKDVKYYDDDALDLTKMSFLGVILETSYEYEINKKYESDIISPSIDINIWKELLNNMIISKIWKW